MPPVCDMMRYRVTLKRHVTTELHLNTDEVISTQV